MEQEDGMATRKLARRWISLGLTLALVVGVTPFAHAQPAAAATGDPFRFIYDQAGRLVTAVTPRP